MTYREMMTMEVLEKIGKMTDEQFADVFIRSGECEMSDTSVNFCRWCKKQSGKTEEELSRYDCPYVCENEICPFVGVEMVAENFIKSEVGGWNFNKMEAMK